MNNTDTGKGYYSLGLCGYEIWPDPADYDYMMAAFVAGFEKRERARRYKIHYTNSDRAYIKVYRRRIYLDEVMRLLG